MDAPRTILILLIVISLLGLSAVYALLNAPLAIKGAYATIGMIIAVGLLSLSRDRGTNLEWLSPIQARKVVLLLSIFSIVLLVSFGAIVIVLGILLPMAYALLFIQYIHQDRVSEGLLAQLTLLFAVGSSAKISVSYFYIGNMDIIKHALFTNQLLREGSPSAISSNYEGFFALHTISGAVSEVTTISTHDSMVILGTLSFAALLGAIFKTIGYISNSRDLAFLSVLLLSASQTYLYFSNYFFPQSFALTLFFFILLVAIIMNRSVDDRVAFSAVLLSAVFVISHHFTFILVLPILGIFLFWDVYRKWHYGIRPSFSWALLALPYLAALYYWGETGKTFFSALIGISSSVIGSFWTIGVSTGGGGQRTILLGEMAIERTIADSLVWLVGVNGLYQISLVALLSLGFVILLTDGDLLNQLVPIYLLGLFGAALLVESPLSIKSLSRLAFPLSIFAFIIGASGLKHLSDDIEVGSRAALGTVILLSVFVAGGGLMAISDVENTQGIEDPRQGSISASEYYQLQASAQFIETHNEEPVSTSAEMNQMLRLFGVTDRSSVEIQDTSIMSRYVLYNENWIQYRVRLGGEGPYLNYMRFSELWLDSYISTKGEVYDAGELGIVKGD